MDIKTKFLRSLKSGKLNMFFVFLALSFMFLILTKLTKEYTKTITFDIVPAHAKENHVILKDTSQKFNITLRTYGFKLLKYYLSRPKLEVDLSDLDMQNQSYIWTNSKGLSYVNKQFSESVKILVVNPDSIFFKYDINAVKKVPVKFQSNIEFVPGFDVSGGFSLNPDSIKVIGPKIMVDTIQSVKTQILKLKNINTDIDVELNIILPDSSKTVTYSSKKVSVTGKVEKFTEGLMEIPVNVVNIPDGRQINYFPKVVTVKYYTSLSNFKNINKNDFIVECDFNDLDSITSFLEPKLIKYPEQVKNVKLVQKQIDFIISK